MADGSWTGSQNDTRHKVWQSQQLGSRSHRSVHMIFSMSREYTHCPEKSAATISLFSATTWSRRVQDALRRIGGRRIQCLLLKAHLHQMGLRRFRRLGRGSSYPKLHN